MNHLDILHQYIQATNTHDFGQVKQLLHPQAVYWFTDKTCTTIEEIQDYFETAWNVIKDEVYRAEDVQWLTVDHNSAACIYTYRYEGYLEGEFAQGSGRAANAFGKDSKGDWKLLHEHLSNNV